MAEELRKIFYGIIIFSVIAMAAFSFSGYFFSTYGTAGLYNETNATKQINSTFALVEDISGGLQNKSTEESSGLDSVITSSYGAMRLVWNLPGLINTILQYVASELNLPEWVVLAIMTGIFVLITFVIVGAVFKSSL